MPRTASKAPTLRDVLHNIDRTLLEPDHKIRSSQILARAVTLCLASALATQEYRKEIGMALSHHRLLHSAAKRVWSSARSYSALSTEVRRLLADGPAKYYREAVQELAAMAPRG